MMASKLTQFGNEDLIIYRKHVLQTVGMMLEKKHGIMNASLELHSGKTLQFFWYLIHTGVNIFAVNYVSYSFSRTTYMTVSALWMVDWSTHVFGPTLKYLMDCC